jgi:hypothetical protein
MDDRLHWAILGVVWLVSAFGSAALIAALYRRLHPELSFYRIWAFWTVLVSVTAALVLALDLV